MRQGVGDTDVNELVDEFAAAGEVDDTVVVGAAGEFARVLLRWTFDQHALGAADHAAADALALFFVDSLQARQPVQLDLLRGVVRQVGGRRARTRAVDEAEAEIEIEFMQQLHGGFEVCFGLTGK